MARASRVLPALAGTTMNTIHAAGWRVPRALLALAGAACLALPATAFPASDAPALATSADGTALLLVTLTQPQPANAVHVLLDSLGPARPLVPEAGVWALRAAPDPMFRNRVLATPGVASAEWSLVRRSDDIVPTAPAPPQPLVPVATPVDTYFNADRQWGLFAGGTTWSPAVTGTGPRPRIAILDGGVDSTHEEWAGLTSPLVRPWSAWTGREQAEDWGRTGHGTHVAGVAAAPANGVGIVGAAPGAAGTAEVIPVQIADRDGYSTDATMMRGIRWAVKNNAKVINISAGGSGASQAFQAVIDWAFAQGALLVASVGNDGQDHGVVNYPAGYAHVLGVAAQCSGVLSVDCPEAYGLARFSDRNASVDVVAPGVGILSSVPRRITDNAIAPGYARKTGTSMAAPYVSGVAALVFAANPGATPSQVMRQIMNTATDGGPPGRDLAHGDGFINVAAAVTLPLPPDDPTEVNDDVAEVMGEAAIAITGAVTVRASIDAHNDPRDVYPVTLRKGQSVRLRVASAGGARMHLAVWAPGTRSVAGRRFTPATATRTASRSPRLGYVASRTGRWFVEVRGTSGRSNYTLVVTR